MQTLEKMTCVKCGRNDIYPETWEFSEKHCDPCFSEKKRLENQEYARKESMAKRIENWNLKCPPQYLSNDTRLIDIIAFKKIVGWRMGPRGLLCTGTSRKGKTTSCWNLLQKIYTQNGVDFQAMSEPEFSQIAAKHSRNRSLDQWLDMLCACKLLFIDDIGHAATSGKHLEELYFVVEKRTSWQKPIIATTQFTSEELEHKAKGFGGEKTVQAILNRLKDSCEIVIFE